MRRSRMNITKKRTKDFMLLSLLIVAILFGLAQRAKESYQQKKDSPLHSFVIR